MMNFIFPILAILSGFLAAADVLIQRAPKLADLRKTLMPYQAGMGLAAMILGVIYVVDISTYAKKMSNAGTILALSCVLASVLVGFILGYGLLQEHVLGDVASETKEKIENVRNKIQPYQVLAGLVAIGSGGFMLITSLF